MLRISHLTKISGGRKVIDDLSLHVVPGALCTLVGPDGAGKTFLLKAAAGVVSFDEGEIYIDGRDICQCPLVCRQQTAYVPEDPDLHGLATGVEYLKFVADIFGVSAEDRLERAARYASLFGLENELVRPAASYSRSTRRKIAIVGAWLHQPKLILLDEPFPGLDPTTAHLLRGMMREVCRQGGTVVFSTHAPESAAQLCDQTAVLRDGRLVRYGTAEFLASPEKG